MRVPISWLRDFTDVEDPAALAERLTAVGLESELHAPPKAPEGVVTGMIVTCERHPNADRLSVCGVDVGDGTIRSIVCGAPNAAAGFVAAAALPGTDLGNGFVIGARKLRGVPSEGMLCSERELGISEEADGILLLPSDTPLGVPLRDILPHDASLTTEPLSNRGDWMSMLGVAREVSAATGAPFRAPEAMAPTGVSSGDWSVDIEDADDCPRYGALVIEGVVVGPSAPWMRQRLLAAGVRPISNVVDATNYVLLERGHPQHAFDADKLTGHRVGVRRARPGESLVTLDGKRRALA
jgi:phenylalanyl-tRNA synthetase beta chain